jgi:hypothetical protein
MRHQQQEAARPEEAVRDQAAGAVARREAVVETGVAGERLGRIVWKNEDDGARRVRTRLRRDSPCDLVEKMNDLVGSDQPNWFLLWTITSYLELGWRSVKR